MGGERETFLEKNKDSEEETSIAQEKGRSIRLHQSGGYIHFHDDAKKKLKCAVPVAVWWKAWERLRGATPGEPQEFSFVDAAEKTILIVVVKCLLDTSVGKYEYGLQTEISVYPCEPDKNYTELAKFTQGGSPR